jgi:hypothetical protein
MKRGRDYRVTLEVQRQIFAARVKAKPPGTHLATPIVIQKKL